MENMGSNSGALQLAGFVLAIFSLIKLHIMNKMIFMGPVFFGLCLYRFLSAILGFFGESSIIMKTLDI
jgi:hypothetical protein